MKGPFGHREIASDGTVHLGRLAALLRDKRVPFELCPSSNVQTGAVGSIAEHPFDLLARSRFRVTVNTDNRLMSDTTMSQEMLRLVEAFGYGWTDLQFKRTRIGDPTWHGSPSTR